MTDKQPTEEELAQWLDERATGLEEANISGEMSENMRQAAARLRELSEQNTVMSEHWEESRQQFERANRLEADRDRYREALQRFGKHDPECHWILWGDRGDKYCNCGFSKALSGEREK